MHSASHGFSPIKPKTSAIWVRKDSLRWVLLTCLWFNSFNFLWTCFVSIFGCFVFFRIFLFNKKKSKNIEKFSKRQKYFILSLVLFVFEDYMSYKSFSWLKTYLILWRNLNSMCYINAKFSLILCECILVCTCTQGLIKKVIFLVCIPSIA